MRLFGARGRPADGGGDAGARATEGPARATKPAAGGGDAGARATEGPAAAAKPAAGGEELTLRRSLTRVDGVCLMISGIVAAAIFIFPGNVLRYMHGGVGPALLMWLAGALLAMCACTVYGELGTAFPRAGGDYEYIKLAFGDRMAFASVFIGQTVQVRAPPAPARRAAPTRAAA